MNNEPEEWEESDRKNSQKDQPQSWEIDHESRKPLANSNSSRNLGFWGGLGLGFLLLFLSGMFSAICQSSVPLFLGAAIALGFLFTPVTRMIFVGYITIIATIFLVFVVVCGPMLGGI